MEEKKIGTVFAEKIAKLFEVKSIVTLCMTLCMAGLLFGPFEPSKEALALFCTSFGSVVTYFFNRKEG